MKTQTEEQLRAEAEVIRRKLGKITDARNKRANRKLLGRCFKYHNSYSGDEKWWLYMRITGAGVSLTGFKFEKTCTGEFLAKQERCCMSVDSWTEIPQVEFDAAWCDFMADLKNAGPQRARRSH